MPETEGKHGDFYLRSPYFSIHILPYSSSIHVSQIASASWPSRTQIICMRQSALHPGGSVLSKALNDRFPDAYSTGGSFWTQVDCFDGTMLFRPIPGYQPIGVHLCVKRWRLMKLWAIVSSLSFTHLDISTSASQRVSGRRLLLHVWDAVQCVGVEAARKQLKRRLHLCKPPNARYCGALGRR
jgi:hypothetical protein